MISEEHNSCSVHHRDTQTLDKSLGIPGPCLLFLRPLSQIMLFRDRSEIKISVFMCLLT